MLKKRSKDFFISADGDIVIDDIKGDIQIADSKELEIFKQNMMRRLMTTKGDFKFAPEVGADLSSFSGLNNTAETGAIIKSNIITALTYDNLFSSSMIDIKVFPMSENAVAILLTAQVSAVETDKFSIAFSYDLRDNKIIPRRL
jgi:hypothetical protein